MFTLWQIAEFCMYRYAMTPDLEYDEILTFYFGMKHNIERVFDIELTKDKIILLASNTMFWLQELERKNDC